MSAGFPSSSEAAHLQPPAAERARTVAAKPAASLHIAGMGICQLWAATTTGCGDVLLVVPRDGAVTSALRNSPLGDVPARLTVTDRTPLPLRHPIRGLVQLSGWLTPVRTEDLPRLLLDFADAYACDSLFDVGLSAILVRLDLAEVLLEEAGTSNDIAPEDFLSARPDAVSGAEAELMAVECDALRLLRGRVQQWTGRQDDVWLLGVDRFGVRFRVESRRGCYDLRVPFAFPLDGPAGFSAAVADLLACGPA
jgi:hypothetical protein